MDGIVKLVQANHLDPGGSHALSKLGWVEEKASTSEVFPKMGPFGTISALPSKRRYECRYLEQGPKWTAYEQMSTISNLSSNKCMIHIVALRRVCFFSGIANLRRFAYEHYWVWEARGLEGCNNC